MVQPDGRLIIGGDFTSLGGFQRDHLARLLPNGTLVLEARRDIQNGDEHWIASLSGVCRREDIQPGNTILSKDIAELKIDKREAGHIPDAYKRGWLTRWMDAFNPF